MYLLATKVNENHFLPILQKVSSETSNLYYFKTKKSASDFLNEFTISNNDIFIVKEKLIDVDNFILEMKEYTTVKKIILK